MVTVVTWGRKPPTSRPRRRCRCGKNAGRACADEGRAESETPKYSCELSCLFATVLRPKQEGGCSPWPSPNRLILKTCILTLFSGSCPKSKRSKGALHSHEWSAFGHPPGVILGSDQFRGTPDRPKGTMVDWVGGSNLSGGQNAWEVFQVQLHIHFANNPCMEYLHTLGWLKRGYCYSKYASPMQCSCFGVSAQTSPTHTHTYTHTHTHPYTATFRSVFCWVRPSLRRRRS